jgi:hypothetical protein
MTRIGVDGQLCASAEAASANPRNGVRAIFQKQKRIA